MRDVSIYPLAIFKTRGEYTAAFHVLHCSPGFKYSAFEIVLVMKGMKTCLDGITLRFSVSGLSLGGASALARIAKSIKVRKLKTVVVQSRIQTPSQRLTSGDKALKPLGAYSGLALTRRRPDFSSRSSYFTSTSLSFQSFRPVIMHEETGIL